MPVLKEILLPRLIAQRKIGIKPYKPERDLALHAT
jgi:hypothetical protein